MSLLWQRLDRRPPAVKRDLWGLTQAPLTDNTSLGHFHVTLQLIQSKTPPRLNIHNSNSLYTHQIEITLTLRVVAFTWHAKDNQIS